MTFRQLSKFDRTLSSAVKMWLVFYYSLKKKDIRLKSARKTAHEFALTLSDLKDSAGEDFGIDFPRTEKMLNDIYEKFRDVGTNASKIHL